MSLLSFSRNHCNKYACKPFAFSFQSERTASVRHNQPLDQMPSNQSEQSSDDYLHYTSHLDLKLILEGKVQYMKSFAATYGFTVHTLPGQLDISIFLLDQLL